MTEIKKFADYLEEAGGQGAFGAALRLARLESGFSIEELTEITKVSSRFIRAIEEDDFSIFLGRVYIIGFTKAYARSVNLDVESVLMALERLLSDQSKPLLW